MITEGGKTVRGEIKATCHKRADSRITDGNVRIYWKHTGVYMWIKGKRTGGIGTHSFDLPTWIDHVKAIQEG